MDYPYTQIRVGDGNGGTARINVQLVADDFMPDENAVTLAIRSAVESISGISVQDVNRIDITYTPIP